MPEGFRIRCLPPALAALAVLTAPAAVAADAPPPPPGLAAKLGQGPFDYRTAEGMDVRVSVFVRGVDHPYSLAFLPDGDLLFTEHAGRLRLVRKGVLDPKPVAGTPPARFTGRGGAQHGYMAVVLHPDFQRNHFLYLAYTKPLDGDRFAPAVARGRFENGALTDLRDIFVAEGIGTAIAMGMVMSRDGLLYVSIGAPDTAQDPNSLGGKILRLREDGSIPPDNPFAKGGGRPEIYTLGHRNVVGMAVHPGTGKVWISEMGPNGGDEINVLEPGRNYGWPLVSLGRTYPGPWQAQGNKPTHDGFEPPVAYWMPSISVTGIAFYTGETLPKWKGDLLVGGLRLGEVPGTGRVDRLRFNANGEELRRETLLSDLHQRVRDVKQGPDGFVYVATDETDGAILRIEPKP